MVTTGMERQPFEPLSDYIYFTTELLPFSYLLLYVLYLFLRTELIVETGGLGVWVSKGSLTELGKHAL